MMELNQEEQAEFLRMDREALRKMLDPRRDVKSWLETIYSLPTPIVYTCNPKIMKYFEMEF